MSHSFTSCVRHRHGLDDLRPEADNIVPLVTTAGMAGMNRKQIGSAVDLDRELLDGLLAGMVDVGLLTVVLRDGVPVFRAGGGVRGTGV